MKSKLILALLSLSVVVALPGLADARGGGFGGGFHGGGFGGFHGGGFGGFRGAGLGRGFRGAGFVLRGGYGGYGGYAYGGYPYDGYGYGDGCWVAGPYGRLVNVCY